MNRYRSLVTGVAATVLVVALAAPAQAAAKATIGFNSRVGQGTKVKITYRVAKKLRGANIALQRTFGTSSKYSTITKLSKASGSVTVKAPIRGKYRYRVIVRMGKRTLATAVRTLYSYSDVPLTAVTHYSTSTTEVGGNLFRYMFSNYSGTDDEYKLDSTSCRGGTLDLAKTGDAGSMGTASISQEYADLQEFNVTSGDIVSYRFTLASRGAVQFSTTDPSGDYGYIFMNGTLSCYTADGQVT